MARTVAIGKQKFAELREGGYFYVDKTDFISRWWASGADVTLICRPRRFGKTLTLSMVECFFSRTYAGRGEDLFGGLEVWENTCLKTLQGTLPVISLSLATVKSPTLPEALTQIKRVLREAVDEHKYLLNSPALTNGDRALLERVSDDMDNVTAATCLGALCSMLHRHWGVLPLVLLDEYDTPLQEAYVHGYWDEMSSFVRVLFNATFKTNPSLGRALITGITRVSQESIFSDLNNPRVVTVSTTQYETDFGFTEAEVARALDEFGLTDLDGVRHWYDGFTFGAVRGIYNPWSITLYLEDRILDTYWANTSGNSLISSLVQSGDASLKEDFATLLDGGTLHKTIDERVAFSQLDGNPDAVWSLLLAAGYVRADNTSYQEGMISCDLTLTNHEVATSFDKMVREWFSARGGSYNGFCKALLADDERAMNAYLGDVARACMSSFDSATHPNELFQPERFWHGLVLGMLVELRGRYTVESNRESGFGRYDVMLVPNDIRTSTDPAIIIEFKVLDREWDGEEGLADTLAHAHDQIEEKAYATALIERGISPERIRTYGIAFQGKKVLVG